MLWKRLVQSFKPKYLPSTLTVLIVLISSTLLTILGILNKIDDAAKLVGILSILTFMAFSEVIERISCLSAIQEDISAIESRIDFRGQGLIKIDKFTSLEQFLEGSRDVLIIGLNKIGLIVERKNFVEKLLKSGCSLRMLFPDPEERNLYNVLARNLDVDAPRLRIDIEQTLATIKLIRKKLSPVENQRLKVLLYDGSPTIGTIIVDGKKTKGKIQIYFYAYQQDPPMRPGLEIYHQQDQDWYDYFVTIYEKLWNDVQSSGKIDRTLVQGL